MRKMIVIAGVFFAGTAFAAEPTIGNNGAPQVPADTPLTVTLTAEQWDVVIAGLAFTVKRYGDPVESAINAQLVPQQQKIAADKK